MSDDDSNNNKEPEKKMKEWYRDRLLNFYLELKQTCQELQENGDPSLASELEEIENNFTRNFPKKKERARIKKRPPRVTIH